MRSEASAAKEATLPPLHGSFGPKHTFTQEAVMTSVFERPAGMFVSSDPETKARVEREMNDLRGRLENVQASLAAAPDANERRRYRTQEKKLRMELDTKKTELPPDFVVEPVAVSHLLAVIASWDTLEKAKAELIKRIPNDPEGAVRYYGGEVVAASFMHRQLDGFAAWWKRTIVEEKEPLTLETFSKVLEAWRGELMKEVMYRLDGARSTSPWANACAMEENSALKELLHSIDWYIIPELTHLSSRMVKHDQQK